MKVPPGANCPICGHTLAPAEPSCPVCLAPRRGAPRSFLSPSRLLWWVLVPLLFLGSCCALLPLGMSLADPMTNAPLDAVPGRRFPVLVLTGTTARVQFLDDVRHVPAAPAGSSYLVPAGREKAIEAAINTQGSDGRWVLRVRAVAPDRQRIELFWMHDGYGGGAYEATRTTVIPLYRKITGPGFAFVCTGAALLVNLVLWSVVLIPVVWWRRRVTFPPAGPSKRSEASF